MGDQIWRIFAYWAGCLLWVVFRKSLNCLAQIFGLLFPNVPVMAIWYILWPFVIFSPFWYILWPFGIFSPFWYILWPFGMLKQEKSGNPDPFSCVDYWQIKSCW
jgi:hypothetical protein